MAAGRCGLTQFPARAFRLNASRHRETQRVRLAILFRADAGRKHTYWHESDPPLGRSDI